MVKLQIKLCINQILMAIFFHGYSQTRALYYRYLMFFCVCLDALPSPRPLTNIEDSDVYRMLQKDQEEPQEPRQSGSFKALQEFIDSDGEHFLFPT